METDASGYAICDMLSRLASETRPDGLVTKTNLSQWYLIAFFLKKMISAKIQYKTHNGKLFAIIEDFKKWFHYFKSYKYKMLIITDYNNFCHFMDTKDLSFIQVH